MSSQHPDDNEILCFLEDQSGKHVMFNYDSGAYNIVETSELRDMVSEILEQGRQISDVWACTASTLSAIEESLCE